MIASMQKTNQSYVINDDVTIGSLDVKALYPSLDIEFTVEIVSNEFYNSEVRIENVDYVELGLYLALNNTYEQLAEMTLDNVCPRRKSIRGAPPTITGSGISITKEKRFSSWIPAINKPNDFQKRIMMKPLRLFYYF